MDRLSERDELFCRRFSETYDATEAAIAAGYGRKRDGQVNRRAAAVQGCRLRKRPEIAERITQITRDAASEAGATPLYIALRLKEVADRCLQEVKPRMEFDREAGRLVETGEYVFNAGAAVRALQTLADVNGMRRETARIEGGVVVSLAPEAERYAD